MLLDIIVFGSVLKDKERPNDLDVCIIMRDKDYVKSDDIIYRITKLDEKLGIPVHCEPIIADDLHKSRLYRTLIQEGLSVRHNKKLSELLGLDSYAIINYALDNKSRSEKVVFSYALYGRKPGEGLLKEIKGISIGKGSVLVPVSHLEEMRSFLLHWKVSCTERNALIFNS